MAVGNLLANGISETSIKCLVVESLQAACNRGQVAAYQVAPIWTSESVMLKSQSSRPMADRPRIKGPLRPSPIPIRPSSYTQALRSMGEVTIMKPDWELDPSSRLLLLLVKVLLLIKPKTRLPRSRCARQPSHNHLSTRPL